MICSRDLEVLAKPGSQQTLGATPVRTTGRTATDFGLINSLLGWEVRSMLPQDAFDAIKDNVSLLVFRFVFSFFLIS